MHVYACLECVHCVNIYGFIYLLAGAETRHLPPGIYVLHLALLRSAQLGDPFFYPLCVSRGCMMYSSYSGSPHRKQLLHPDIGHTHLQLLYYPWLLCMLIGTLKKLFSYKRKGNSDCSFSHLAMPIMVHLGHMLMTDMNQSWYT